MNPLSSVSLFKWYSGQMLPGGVRPLLLQEVCATRTTIAQEQYCVTSTILGAGETKRLILTITAPQLQRIEDIMSPEYAAELAIEDVVRAIEQDYFGITPDADWPKRLAVFGSNPHYVFKEEERPDFRLLQLQLRGHLSMNYDEVSKLSSHSIYRGVIAKLPRFTGLSAQQSVEPVE